MGRRLSRSHPRRHRDRHHAQPVLDRVPRPERSHRHARPSNPIHPRRARGRPRLQGRPLQHRRARPVPDGCPGRCDPGCVPGGRSLVHRCSAGSRRGPGCGCRLRLRPRLAEGVYRRSRSRGHDHAQLRGPGHRLVGSDWAAALGNGDVRTYRRRRPGSAADPRRQQRPSAALGRAYRLRGGPDRMVDPLSHDDRLRGPHRRRQSRRGSLCRHAPAPPHHRDHGRSRPACRTRRRHRGSSACSTTCRPRTPRPSASMPSR